MECPTDTAMPKLIFVLISVWVAEDITAQGGGLSLTLFLYAHIKDLFKAF